MESSCAAAGTRLTRRALLKLCIATATALAMPASLGPLMAEVLATRKRRPVIWLSCQECTGCTESLTRADAPTLERLLFELLSLDYHHTLQAAAGEAGENARLRTMSEYRGEYLLVVDGSIPTGAGGGYSTIAGVSNLDLLRECAATAAAVIALGTCAAFGGLPMAAPNPTGARDVATLMREGCIPARPLVNLPGCPPIPETIAAVLLHFLVFERFPELDELTRPRVSYGATVHKRCSRYHHFVEGRFAERFDDEGARRGWCLLRLGCRGPLTHNACPTLRWNQGTSYPVEAGHPCIGCSEPGFWDRGGFYQALHSEPAHPQTAASDAERGVALFDDNCVYCHLPSRKPFRTAPAEIPELLRHGNVRSHRFSFTNAQLADLAEYLKTLEKQP
jgi:hydrogenase small subunit